MTVPHSQLGVRGDRGPPDAPRIELVMADTATGAEFVALDGDGDGVGNFARVYRGRVRFGGFELPVAVKVQRDEALVREQSESVAAKFAAEFAVHRALADRDPGDGGGVVRQFAFAFPPDEPATLPPAILCRHARHALAPRCPTCGRPLAVDPWPTDDDERVLTCDTCPDANRFPSARPVRDRVLKATVRQDAACDGCAKSDAECAASARWLTFFPARTLAFELLELDLDDFIRGRFARHRHARHQAFWRRADAARDEFGPGPLGRLGEGIDLFAQLVAGVATLHRSRITHLDLKPRNVCLTDDGGRVRLKVIDLGFATDPAGLPLFYQRQGTRVIESDSAAPEVRVPVTRTLSARLARVAGEVAVVLDRVPLGGRDGFDPLVLPNDEVVANGEHRGRVRQVRYHDAAVSLVVEWSGPAPTQFTTVDIIKQSGPPADLFSLGMMLFGLVLGETDLRAARDALPQWMAAVGHGPTESATPRRLTERLFRAAGQMPTVADLSAKVTAAFQEYTPVAHALVGIALRLLFRAPGCYLRHRGDDATGVLPRLAEDVRAIRGEWAAVVARHRADAERETTASAVRALMSHVGGVPVGPVTATGQPPFEPVLLRAVARAVNPTDEAGVRAAAAELLERYHADTGKLTRHLRRLIDDRPDPAAAGFDGRILFEMLLFADPTHFEDADLPRVRGSAEKVAQYLGRRLPAEGTRVRLEHWRERADRVLAADARWDDRQRLLKGFFDWAEALLAEPPGRGKRRTRLDLRLSEENRPPVSAGKVDAALDELELLRGEVLDTRWSALERRWAAAVKAWDADALPKTVRDTLRRTREAAEETMDALRRQVTDADRRLGDLIRRLRHAVAVIENGVLRAWDEGLANRGWLSTTIFGAKRALSLSLDVSLADEYDADAPSDAVRGLARHRCGPATVAYLAGLLDELRDIQLAENATKGGA